MAIPKGQMKAPMLPVTLFLLITTISCQSQSAQPKAHQENQTCDSWFPEPLKTQPRVLYPRLTEKFQVVDDFLEDLDRENWKNVSKEYIVRSLDGETLGSFEILKIVLGNVGSIRNLFISFLCIILAKLLFFVIWSMGLFDVFQSIGIHLKFQKHHYGLTIVPITCILCILILNSHFNHVTEIAMDGLKNLETGDDQSFMPVKDRIRMILKPLTCKFENTFKGLPRPVGLDLSQLYLKETVNGSVHKIDEFPLNPGNTSGCASLNERMREIDFRNMVFPFNFHEPYPDLHNLSLKMAENYMNMTKDNMLIAFSVFAKALGSLDQFVERFHSDVLQLPSHGSLWGYYSVIVTMTGITVAVACVFATLLIMQVQLRKKWLIFMTYFGVFLMVLFSVICISLFLTIFIKIAFILLTQTACIERKFKIFMAAKPTNFTEHGYTYHVNYGDYLMKSYYDYTTWFSLVKNHESYRGKFSDIPIALQGERLFRPDKQFNETFNKFLNISMNYPDFNRRGCEAMDVKIKEFLELAKNHSCQEPEIIKLNVDFFEKSKNQICSGQPFLDAKPKPSREAMTQKAWEFWKKALIPHLSYGILRRTEVQNSFGIMQLYQVLMNPAMKLRPNVLEPWFAMAGLTMAMAPFLFVIAIFLMCITPGLINDKGVDSKDSNGLEKTATTRTNTISKSNTKSTSNDL